MSIYYCAKHPNNEEHREFKGRVKLVAYWIFDEDGDCIDDSGSGRCTDGPDYSRLACLECGSQVLYGQPPSPLEQLAKEA